MSGQDLYIELRDRYAYLDQALKAYRRYGRTYGKAESDYREALTTEMLKKRDEGMPVTILSDVCSGVQGCTGGDPGVQAANQAVGSADRSRIQGVT